MKRIIAVVLAIIGFSGSLNNAAAGAIQGTLTTKMLTDQTAQLEFRLNEPTTDTLLVWAWKLGFNQRLSLPIKATSPGLYRATAPMTEGVWRYYARVGPGQAGYISREAFSLEKTETSAPIVLGNQFENTVPSYVQPVGYAVWAVILALALALTGAVLGRLSRRAQPA